MPVRPLDDDNHADISNLLAEKNGLHKAYMDLWTDATKAAFLRCRRLLQQRLREMQDAWKVRKAIYSHCIKGTASLLSFDGTPLLKRCAEHCRSVLNHSSSISDAAINQLPQVNTNNDLDLPPFL
ncbi:unnamed protein product [Schistocephalus solidus]|uniref:Uncharacterized protein n=1 Tax=Schistocephalus solidus TaxID=70667 RepID=A0A183T8D6_SCHSO|nr:unnamed protein product [Schistocephalus solidus]